MFACFRRRQNPESVPYITPPTNVTRTDERMRNLVSHDSQDDSQIAGLLRTAAHDVGMCELAIELQRTLMNGYGH